MARNSAEDKLEHSEEEDEEEALSLCDLPVNLNKEESRSSEQEIQETEDFDFDGCVSSTSEMCAADDIFFKGQILPFRLSVSSENGNCIISKSKQEISSTSRCLSRSESMDHGSVGGFTSFSSRSSSSRSQFSLSSSNSSSLNTRISNSRVQNQFLTHSSPKPQIRITSSLLGNQNRNRKSTVWEFFRLGLVRAPEIEFQELKARNSVSRNSSTSSSSNCSITSSNNQGKKMQKQRKEKKQSSIEKRLLLSGCNCTTNSVKPVPLNVIITKSNNEKNEETKEEKEKQQEMKIKKKKKKKNQKKKKQENENGGKQAMSRHRTFEWIKELSHSSFLDHEEGHIA